MSVLGLILGIIGLAGGIICPFAFPMIGFGELIFVVLAILGLIFSIIGRGRSARGAGTAGMVLSIIAIVLSMVFTFTCATGRKAVDTVKDELSTMDQEQLDGIQEQLQSAVDEIAENLTTEANDAAPEENQEEPTAETEGAVEAAAPAGDLTPEITVAYGDYEAIRDLAKKAQNFEVSEGTVAQISGVLSTTFSTPAIQEADGDGGYVGLSMYVDGDWDVPADRTDLDVIGTFVKGNFNMEFHVSPENITVK